MIIQKTLETKNIKLFTTVAFHRKVDILKKKINFILFVPSRMIIQIVKFLQKERFVIMAKDLSTSTNSR